MEGAPLYGMRIRERRTRFGLSQTGLAQALDRLAWERAGRPARWRALGVDQPMVSDWERGRHRPDAFYQELLCALFDATPYELGFRARLPWEAGVIDSDDEERMILAAREPSRLDPHVIDSLATILAAQRRTEDSVGSAPLIEPVTAQLAAIERLVVDARGPLRPSVLDVAAQWAQFAGWLNANTGRPARASRWYDWALEWATEAGAHNMVATALNMKGHLAWIAGNVGPMVGLSQAAQRDGRISPGVRALAVQQEARGHALSGHGDDTDRKLSEAAELVLRAADNPSEPPWIYFFDPDYLVMQRGLACQILGRNEQTITLLSSGLDALPAEVRNSEWVAWYLYRLAVAYTQVGAPDQACAIALEATRNVRATNSARMLGQLRRFHARLVETWPNDPAVIELGDATR